MNDPIILVLIAAALAILICVIIAIIQYKRNKIAIVEQIRAEEDARLEREPEYTELYVTVTALACSAHSVGHQGHKLPKSERVFSVCFTDSEGKQLQLSVSEEMYFAFEEGQEGILTLVDGELYSFVANEENAE
ncbi:MAG: hypothetical protein IJY24_06990 [Clostridia bacterium]|nr:hypothetical protein [Clostridia bacterium]